ncbi:MAG: hypothetical protein ACT6QS_01630 [Flavobacteriales bacterium]
MKKRISKLKISIIAIFYLLVVNYGHAQTAFIHIDTDNYTQTADSFSIFFNNNNIYKDVVNKDPKLLSGAFLKFKRKKTDNIPIFFEFNSGIEFAISSKILFKYKYVDIVIYMLNERVVVSIKDMGAKPSYIRKHIVTTIILE